MPKAIPDLSQRMTTPWAAFFLTVGGGILLGRDLDAVFRVAGLLAVAGGGGLLALRAWQGRSTMAQVLALRWANSGSLSSGQLKDCLDWLMSTPDISMNPKSWQRERTRASCSLVLRGGM